MAQSLLKVKEVPRGVKMVIFGNPKTGKTELAAWLAKEYNILWLDLDNGIGTVLESPQLNLTDADLERITYIKIPDTYGNTVGIQTLVSLFTSKTAGYICEDHGVWNCKACVTKKSEFAVIDLKSMTPQDNWIVIVDSGTQLAASALNKIIHNSKIDRSTMASDKEDYVSLKLWGAQGYFMDEVLTEIKNRNLNVVMTAHEQEGSGDDKVKKLYPAIGTSNFSARVGGYFTQVVHTGQKLGKFVIESANGSSNRVDCGGHLNLDINGKPEAIVDFFKPAANRSTISSVPAKKLGSKLGAK